MHPGPDEPGCRDLFGVADSPRSVILEQVSNGVAVRMAVLYLLATGHRWEGRRLVSPPRLVPRRPSRRSGGGDRRRPRPSARTAAGSRSRSGRRFRRGTPRLFDAKGLLVLPGFIDLHTHLREPGREYAETIATGLKRQRPGGFTAICAMPNTDPVADNRPSWIRCVQGARRRRHAAVSDRRDHAGPARQGARGVRRDADCRRRRPLR